MLSSACPIVLDNQSVQQGTNIMKIMDSVDPGLLCETKHTL